MIMPVSSFTTLSLLAIRPAEEVWKIKRRKVRISRSLLERGGRSNDGNKSPAIMGESVCNRIGKEHWVEMRK